MRFRIAVLTTALVAILTLLPATAAMAEGGSGQSFCSNAGAPAGFDGTFDPFPNNPGEVIAWVAQNVGLSGTNNPGGPIPYVPYIVGCHPSVQ